MPLVEYEEVNGVLVPHLGPGTPVVLLSHPVTGRGGAGKVGEVHARLDSGLYLITFPNGSSCSTHRDRIQPLYMSNVEPYLNGEFDAQ